MVRVLPDADDVVAPLIDGAASESRGDSVLVVINPSNGQRCLSIPAGCDADVDRAVMSARRAFDDGRWHAAQLSSRKRALHKFAELVAADASALDTLDAGEMGKPVSLAVGSAVAAASMLRFYAEALDKVLGDVYASDAGSFVAQRRIPRGVVGAVVPWNFPTYNAVLKLAPALAAGNCVVLKPSELASRSALRLSRLALHAGIPPGVLNVVPGAGEIVGRALGLHAGVDMLTFTGSTKVGKLMLEYSGQSNMKLVMAECGGKSPHIVFNDGVDLDAASSFIAQSLLTNQGQVCSLGSRLILHRSIETEMIGKIVNHCRRAVIGDALELETTFGPLASSRQCDRVMRYIETAPAEGAQLMFGGQRILRETGGFFVQPTVFRHVSPDARIAQDEIFGPVLSVLIFDDEAEAIRIAKNSRYGLAAYVWTASVSTGMRVANGIPYSVRVNAAAPTGESAGHSPSFEPSGQSGIGVEGGLAGLESYLRRQRVWISHA